MNKIEKKHLEAIVDETYPSSDGHRVEGKKEAATSCAEITKEYAMEFAEWISVEGHIPNRHYKGQFISTEFLWNLFLNDLNEKP